MQPFVVDVDVHQAAAAKSEWHSCVGCGQPIKHGWPRCPSCRSCIFFALPCQFSPRLTSYTIPPARARYVCGFTSLVVNLCTAPGGVSVSIHIAPAESFRASHNCHTEPCLQRKATKAVHQRVLKTCTGPWRRAHPCGPLELSYEYDFFMNC